MNTSRQILKRKGKLWEENQLNLGKANALTDLL